MNTPWTAEHSAILNEVLTRFYNSYNPSKLANGGAEVTRIIKYMESKGNMPAQLAHLNKKLYETYSSGLITYQEIEALVRERRAFMQQQQQRPAAAPTAPTPLTPPMPRAPAPPQAPAPPPPNADHFRKSLRTYFDANNPRLAGLEKDIVGYTHEPGLKPADSWARIRQVDGELRQSHGKSVLMNEDGAQEMDKSRLESSLRTALTAYFQRVAPAKVANVDAIVKRTVVCGLDGVVTLREMLFDRYKQVLLVPELMMGDGIIEEQDNFMDELSGLRERLAAFYQQHAPEKMAVVDEVVHFATERRSVAIGRLDLLNSKLREKYGVDLKSVPASGSSGRSQKSSATNASAAAGARADAEEKDPAGSGYVATPDFMKKGAPPPPAAAMPPPMEASQAAAVPQSPQFVKLQQKAFVELSEKEQEALREQSALLLVLVSSLTRSVMHAHAHSHHLHLSHYLPTPTVVAFYANKNPTKLSSGVVDDIMGYISERPSQRYERIELFNNKLELAYGERLPERVNVLRGLV